MSGKKQVTIRDIAERLQISPTVVSTALTGRRNGTFIGEETRRRVWKTAQEMNYSLDRLRSAIGRLQRVALFVRPHFHYAFYGTIIELCRLLNQQGCQVFTEVNPDRPSQCVAAKRLYRRGEIDGAIFMGSRLAPEDADFGDMPCVVVGELPAGIQGWQVTSDNEVGGRMVGEHLWSLGHRRIGMLFPGRGVMIPDLRLKGLQSVWQEHGVQFEEDWRLEFAYEHPSDLIEKLPAFLKAHSDKGQRLTALFCFDDWLAANTLHVLRDLELRVPDDISIVGFNDELLAGVLAPPLTTIRVPWVELVTLAAQLLTQRVNAPSEPPRTYTLAPTLVVRGSTGPASE